MAPRATWRVGQEAGARGNHGQEPLIITYYYRWNLLGANVPCGAGSKTDCRACGWRAYNTILVCPGKPSDNRDTNNFGH